MLCIAPSCECCMPLNYVLTPTQIITVVTFARPLLLQHLVFGLTDVIILSGSSRSFRIAPSRSYSTVNYLRHSRSCLELCKDPF